MSRHISPEMRKFLIVLSGGRQVRKSPSELQVHLNDWLIWMNHLKAKGYLLQADPFKDQGYLFSRSADKVSVQPVLRANAGGYILVEVGSVGELIAIANSCPIFQNDGTLEVFQIYNPLPIE